MIITQISYVILSTNHWLKSAAHFLEIEFFCELTLGIFRFDKVLVDDRVIRLIPQFLGSAFYKKNKLPVQVSLTKKNLKDEVSRLLSLKLCMYVCGVCVCVCVCVYLQSQETTHKKLTYINHYTITLR